ncbi:MAG: phage baseplate upper protein [Actinomycetota bacterium]|nr:phage baseplate upper protein [Actinomycetota bacterium]
MADSWLKANDTAPRLTSTLEDRNGDPVNLSDADVRIHVREIRGATVLDDVASIDQVADGSNGSKGTVSYDFGEPLAAGGYHYEWEVTYGDGSIETFPNASVLSLAVLESLGEEAS